jgi:hypothetical protein
MSPAGAICVEPGLTPQAHRLSRLRRSFPLFVASTAVALAVGVVKSRAVLDRAARGVIEQIRARGDGRCVGGFLSLRTRGSCS